MSSDHKAHNISKVHTFKEDVEELRLNKTEDTDNSKNESESSADSSETENKKTPVINEVIYTPQDVVDASADNSKKDAGLYLEKLSIKTPTKQITAEPNKKNELPKIPTAPEVEPTKIPPIKSKTNLDLTNEINALTAKSQKASILSDSENIYDADSEAELPTGTIIKDKKRRRKSFLSELLESINHWFASLAEKTKPDKSEPEIETKTSIKQEEVVDRREVIDKAISHKATAPKEDFSEISKNLKKQEPHLETKLNSETEPKPTPIPEENTNWTHLLSDDQKSGEEYLGVDEPTKIPVVSRFETEVKDSVENDPTISQWLENATTKTSDTEDRVLEVEPFDNQTNESDTNEEMTVEEVPEEKIPTEAETDTRDEADEEVESTKEPEEIPEVPLVTQAADAISFTLRNRPQEFRFTNRLSPILLIAFLATTFGVGVSWFLLGSSTEPNQTVTLKEPPALINTDNKIPIQLTNDRTEWINEIKNISDQNDRLTQIYPTALSPQGREEPASASTILQFFDGRIPGSFARSITDLTFGSDATGQPFMVIKVSQFDTAFAGMLAWESNMSADLSPLFGSPVSSTLDPQARTTNSLRQAFFVDSIIANRSSRVLYDELGLARIIYTFVNQQTILIGTNSTSITQIGQQLR
ncbi:hypothetical protein KC845_00085 [Candidatus Kaiserbacteria bacterium]|nr:hypothetical protein [Candidatus Kaiserbacteria bacterium]